MACSRLTALTGARQRSVRRKGLSVRKGSSVRRIFQRIESPPAGPACSVFRQAERLAEEQRGLFCRTIDSNGEKNHKMG
jgi:hypothetical protein